MSTKAKTIKSAALTAAALILPAAAFCADALDSVSGDSIVAKFGKIIKMIGGVGAPVAISWGLVKYAMAKNDPTQNANQFAINGVMAGLAFMLAWAAGNWLFTGMR